MRHERTLIWKARIFGIWYSVLVVILLVVGHAVMAIHTFIYYDLSFGEGIFALVYFCATGWFFSAFIIGFSKLAVYIELTDGELIARGLLGRQWKVPLEEIESFRDGDIFLRGSKRPLLQIGVLLEGMRPFAEALQKQTSQKLVVENENLIKQGRW